MKMTKLEALQESLKMWEWMLDNYPGEIKNDYLTLRYKNRADWPLNQCFACEYVYGEEYRQSGHVECPGNCIIDWGCNKPYACEDCVDSPYWKYTDDEGGTEAIEDIIKLHKQAIERELECQKCTE